MVGNFSLSFSTLYGGVNLYVFDILNVMWFTAVVGYVLNIFYPSIDITGCIKDDPYLTATSHMYVLSRNVREIMKTQTYTACIIRQYEYIIIYAFESRVWQQNYN